MVNYNGRIWEIYSQAVELLAYVLLPFFNNSSKLANGESNEDLSGFIGSQSCDQITVVSGTWVVKCSVSLDAALHISPSQSSELMRLLKNGPVLVLVLVRCLMLVVRRVG